MIGRHTFMAFGTLALLTLTPFFRVSVSACPEGLFGNECEVMCHCQGGNKNCDQGNCTQGCDQKFIGRFCQYKGYPPLEQNDRIWLQDGNPQTCNDGTTPLVVLPTFATSVTYMRVTFQQPDLLRETAFRLFHVEEDGKDTVMTCSYRLTLSVDQAGKVYDVPCFTSQVVHFIEFGGDGAGKLCELLISPGRNIAPFQTVFLQSESAEARKQARLVIDGYNFHDKNSFSVCGKIERDWSLNFETPCEVNMIIVFNVPDQESAVGLGMFKLYMSSRRAQDFFFAKMDFSYSAFYIVVLDQKEVDIQNLNFFKKDHVYDYYLCELEVIGDLHCCGDTHYPGCLGSKGSSPLCSKKEFTYCRPGYHGDFCDEECGEGYYGPNCIQECNPQCKEKRCNRQTGQCLECNAGYAGPICDAECSADSYGPGCNKRCSENCKEITPGQTLLRRCRADTGECIYGCKSGRVGQLCQYERCSVHCKGGNMLCDRKFGTCLLGCKPGYMGLYCYTECPAGTYGEGCRQRCSPDCLHHVCHKVDGSCVHGCGKGVEATSECDKECAKGTYGQGCNERCSSHCSQGECDKKNGTCIHGCQPGYVAPLCKQTCPAPFYGQGCNQKCSSSCKGQCNPVTGNCDLCKRGAYGPHCHKACPPGTWGRSCLQSCADKCSGRTTCVATTGKCIRCPSGKRGKSCTRDCGFGKYGLGCNQFCSEYCFQGACYPANGSCTMGCVGKWAPPFCTGCLPGWHGIDCEEACSLFCKHSKCDLDTGKCMSCVHGRTGDLCQDRTHTGVPMKNYIFAGLLVTGLVSFVAVMSFCIREIVKEHERENLEREGKPTTDTDSDQADESRPSEMSRVREANSKDSNVAKKRITFEDVGTDGRTLKKSERHRSSVSIAISEVSARSARSNTSIGSNVDPDRETWGSGEWNEETTEDSVAGFIKNKMAYLRPKNNPETT